MTHPERIVPDETSPGIVALHRKRYEFAKPWCDGRLVLDLACGVGYGTHELATIAAHVVGVDQSADALAYARRRYSAANVEFAVMDAAALDFDPGSFDAVCAFEAIEHFDAPEAVLAEVARVLVDDGAFLVSTPRADRTTDRPENPWHRTEYDAADFERLLAGHFGRVELYGQRRLQTRRHRLFQRLDVLGLRKRLTFLRPASRVLGTAPMADVTAAGIVIEKAGLERATELVAVCTHPRR